MSDQPQIIRAKGKRGGQPGNRNAFKHGYRGLCAPEPLVREGYARNPGLVSPTKLPEKELRNLLGEAAMSRSLRPRASCARGVEDYMYFLYNCNIVSHDSVAIFAPPKCAFLARKRGRPR